eukprot:scaffold4002_cov123-Isochrysis_galbana.AAC.8
MAKWRLSSSAELAEKERVALAADSVSLDGRAGTGLPFAAVLSTVTGMPSSAVLSSVLFGS